MRVPILLGLRIVLGFALLSAALGCQPRRAGSGSQGKHEIKNEWGENVWINLEQETGEVLAGVEVSHRFTLTNEFPSVIRIRSDDDIMPGCGCAAVTPTARELAPGATASVTVKVDTAGLSGPFKTGGRINWTDADNKGHVSKFDLVGVARPPLVLEPLELVFGRDDITKGSAKDLEVTIDDAVDKKSLRVETPRKEFRIEQKSMRGRVLIYAVKCLVPLPPDEEELIREIVFTAKMTESNGGMPLCVKVPLYIRDSMLASVQPNNVVVRFGRSDDRGVARLVVIGEALKAPDGAIESISCADYRVEWQATRFTPTSASLVVALTLIHEAGTPWTKDSSLEIKVKGLKPLQASVQVQTSN